MKRGFLVFAVVALSVAIAAPVLAGSPHVKPPPGNHYNLNIIGFAKCKKTNSTDPDCFKGNAGDIVTHGHTIFVPLKTAQTEVICDTDDPVYVDPYDVTVAELLKGVRIQVSDGDDMQVIDRDATDGLARFVIPHGCYSVWARPLGKPGGCMDIDTIICYDEDDPANSGDPAVYDFPDDYVQVACDGANLTSDLFVAVGHIDVDRSKGRPHWENVTNDMLNEATAIDGENYFDFLWEIYNDNLRLVQLRFYEEPCS